MKFGVQLFSLRGKLQDEDGYKEVFKRVKDMGAEVVQLSGGKPVAAEFIASLVKEYDLPVCITHDSFQRITDDLDGLIKEHKIYGCNRLGIGMMPKEFRTGELKDIDRFIEILNKTAERLDEHGMTIAYHNHWFEFDEIDGQVIYDHIVENTEKVEFISDTFWMRVKNKSVEEYLKKLNGRVNTLHLKDYKKTLGIPVFRAVGKGEIDFKSILCVAKDCGVENAVAELDLSPNPYESMQFSMKTMEKLKKYVD